MPRIYLVRHGRAAAGWDFDPDPDLDNVGLAQAAAVAEQLVGLGPLPIVSSPLLRCRRTAASLSAAWNTEARIEPLVAEIPSPEGVAMTDRVSWLRAAMAGTWTDLGPRYTEYRDLVVATVATLPADTVVFSHFVAINVLVGAALGRDELVIRSLDNCSVTTIHIGIETGTDTGVHPIGHPRDQRISLIEGGHEADTLIR
jgi:broad specificity phosphatase PhoE